MRGIVKWRTLTSVSGSLFLVSRQKLHQYHHYCYRQVLAPPPARLIRAPLRRLVALRHTIPPNPQFRLFLSLPSLSFLQPPFPQVLLVSLRKTQILNSVSSSPPIQRRHPSPLLSSFFLASLCFSAVVQRLLLRVRASWTACPSCHVECVCDESVLYVRIVPLLVSRRVKHPCPLLVSPSHYFRNICF